MRGFSGVPIYKKVNWYEEDLHDYTRITTDQLSKYFDFYDFVEYILFEDSLANSICLGRLGN